MKGPAKSTRSTSKLTQWQTPVTVTPIHSYKPMPCQSLFRKALPRKPVASADTHTTTVNAQPKEPHAVSVATRTTGLSNVEALGGGTVQPVTHPPWEGHRIDSDASAATSQTKAEDMEAEGIPSRNLLPKGQVVAMAEEEANPSRQTP